jgi:hypothetical protein
MDLSPRAARVEAEEAWGARLHAWIARSGTKVADVAHSLGMKRRELYYRFDGDRSFPAAWLALLPPAVQFEELRERVDALGYRLEPLADLPADYDHGADAAAYLSELTDCPRVRMASEADGTLTVAEVDRELREIEEARAALSRREAFLRHARRERGGVVARIVDRAVSR